MGRRRHTYGRRKKINIKPIIILVLILSVIVALGIKISSSGDYAAKIDEILSSNILKTTGNISSTSSIDTHVYSNDGLKYTNKHENIIKLNSFDSGVQGDESKTETVKKLLDNLSNLEDAGIINELSPKESGYYWIDVNMVVSEKMLIFNSEDEYNLDLYYDIAEQKVYIKNKYYDEFSKKNNKAKLKAYKANDEYKKLIEELAKSNEQ